MGLVSPGTEIGVFSKIVLFNIVFFNVVFFNVASTKSSNTAGIPSFGGLLGLIRKRLVEFRLDFLAFIRIDQILTSPSLVDIPPVFVFCAVVAPGLVDSGSLVTENGHRVFLWVWVWVWPVPYAGCAMKCTPLGRVMDDGETE